MEHGSLADCTNLPTDRRTPSPMSYFCWEITSLDPALAMSELFIPSNNNYLHKTIQFSLNNQKHGPDASPFLVHNSINEIICRRGCFVPLTKRTGGGKLSTSGKQAVPTAIRAVVQ